MDCYGGQEAPLWGGMAGMSEVIWVRHEAECFCEGDWTGQITLIRLKKSAFFRKSRKRVTASKRAVRGVHEGRQYAGHVFGKTKAR
jgi:hypothetical protein